jgi:ribosomal protein L35AE/L33A
MPTVEKSAHLGILRSKSNQKTENSQIEQNITKARRTAYSLLSTRVIYLISNIASMGSKPDMMYIAGSGALVGRDSICLSMFFLEYL